MKQTVSLYETSFTQRPNSCFTANITSKMESKWKIGFLGLLVVAGLGLVMAGVGQEDTGCNDDLCGLSVEEKAEEAEICFGGCGNETGTCGADCDCGCQKIEPACSSGKCGSETCGGDCPKSLGCGCGN